MSHFEATLEDGMYLDNFERKGRTATGCLFPGVVLYDDPDDDIWGKDLEKHSFGEFSCAFIQANYVLEELSQVETAWDAIFVGVYDGHGGGDCVRFVRENFFPNLIYQIKLKGTVSEEVIKCAFAQTEDAFYTYVDEMWRIRRSVVASGSCCLVGIIWRGTIYVASLGDSRAVAGCLDKSKNIFAQQLTADHSTNVEAIRHEIMMLNPDVPNVVIRERGAWRLKGINKISRSIGDIYLKRPEYNLDTNNLNRRTGPLPRPAISAEPCVFSRLLLPSDRFIIFASDGLWDHLTNEEAVEIVHNSPREGIAKRLLKAALHNVAKKRNMRYGVLRRFDANHRQDFHDDITVIVVFTDYKSLGNPQTAPEISVWACRNTVLASRFNMIRWNEVFEKLGELEPDAKYEDSESSATSKDSGPIASPKMSIPCASPRASAASESPIGSAPSASPNALGLCAVRKILFATEDPKASISTATPKVSGSLSAGPKASGSTASPRGSVSKVPATGLIVQGEGMRPKPIGPPPDRRLTQPLSERRVFGSPRSFIGPASSDRASGSTPGPKPSGSTASPQAEGYSASPKASGSIASSRASVSSEVPEFPGLTSSPKSPGPAAEPKTSGSRAEPEASESAAGPEVSGSTASPEVSGSSAVPKESG